MRGSSSVWLSSVQVEKSMQKRSCSMAARIVAANAFCGKRALQSVTHSAEGHTFGDTVTPMTGMVLKSEENQLVPLFSSTCSASM